MVRKLYQSYVQSLVRVVHGVPAFWDSTAASTTRSVQADFAVWSPCNRFIAVLPGLAKRVDILDSATLQRLQSLEFQPKPSTVLQTFTFSPDSRMLTAFIGLTYKRVLVSWDLQTGGVVSVIEWKRPRSDIQVDISLTYSKDGKTVATLSRCESSTIISAYDVFSGVHMDDAGHGAHTIPHLDLGASCVHKIWAHGGSLRFATPEPAGITIWEVGVALGATPMEVETVPIPDNAGKTLVFKPSDELHIVWAEFHPCSESYRLAFVDTHSYTDFTVLVWDTRASRFLLRRTNPEPGGVMSFSSDGSFFAYSAPNSGAYLWKESSIGYTLFQRFTTVNRDPQLLLSPNGESIVTLDGPKIQLWHTKGFTAVTSNLVSQPLRHADEEFILRFLSDRPFAVTSRRWGKTVTVLDLELGAPQLTIDTSIQVYGLESSGSTVAVVGRDTAIIWNLPGGNFHPGARMDIGDSTHTINFPDVASGPIRSASISRDFGYVALSWDDHRRWMYQTLNVYCTSTGQSLRVRLDVDRIRFAPDGHDIWCARGDGAQVYTVTSDALDRIKGVDIEDGSRGSPWGSLCGYRVADDGWILDAGGKRVLMLPPLWQSRLKADRVWNGKFLALLHVELPEVVILELEP